MLEINKTNLLSETKVQFSWLHLKVWAVDLSFKPQGTCGVFGGEDKNVEMV